MRKKRVLLVAMSGVRIYDPELRALGMTLPGFIERGKVIASMPSLGLLTLAGATPPDWEVSYWEIDELEECAIQPLLDDPAELVAISSLTARIEDAYRLAGKLRDGGKSVVIGGLHASVMPEEALNYVNAVVIGEAESAWERVLQDFDNGNLQRIYRSTRLKEFPSGIMPRYSLLDINRYNRIPVQTTRGCPFDCSFCAASRLISPYKRKSIEQVDRELETISSRWRRPFIELADDNTFVNKNWGRQLAAVMKKHKARWFTETDISVAEDAELLDALAESGCVQLLIGFESIDERSLVETDTKGWKRSKRERYLQAIEEIQKRGISVNGCFAFGFDSDDRGCFERTFDFIRESKLTEVQVTILTPFPGTALYARLKCEKRLLNETMWSRCTLFDVTYRPARMSPDELRGGFRDLVAELYSRRETDRRKSLRRRYMSERGRRSAEGDDA